MRMHVDVMTIMCLVRGADYLQKVMHDGLVIDSFGHRDVTVGDLAFSTPETGGNNFFA